MGGVPRTMTVLWGLHALAHSSVKVMLSPPPTHHLPLVTAVWVQAEPQLL